MTHPDPCDYADRIRRGDRRVLSRTITLIESALPEHRKIARDILHLLLPDTGRAVRLGITGVPGVGKSTFIENLGMLLTGKGHRVAVLAVDPSSSRSGGSVMADKTRMQRLSVAKNAFIRPSPSGGALGGVGRVTRETLLLCEAAGFDVIIVETVGVGQSETTVSSMVDFFLVLMLAGAGDELQGIKKGVLELADAIVVNKADGGNIVRANAAREVYERALRLLNPPSAVWSPPVLTASALTGDGIAEVWQTVLDHRHRLEESGELARKRSRQALDWMCALLEEGIRRQFFDHPRVRRELDGYCRKVEKGMLAPMTAARELLFLLDNESAV